MTRAELTRRGYSTSVKSRTGYLGPTRSSTTLAETRVEIRSRDSEIELTLAPLPGSAELTGGR